MNANALLGLSSVSVSSSLVENFGSSMTQQQEARVISARMAQSWICAVPSSPGSMLGFCGMPRLSLQGPEKRSCWTGLETGGERISPTPIGMYPCVQQTAGWQWLHIGMARWVVHVSGGTTASSSGYPWQSQHSTDGLGSSKRWPGVLVG